MPRIIGVFNAADTPNPGGVQVSGHIAWQAISAAGSGFQAKLLSASIEQSGRLRLAMRAARMGGAADCALFWHLDLLKLAPFLRLESGCRRVLFLHGIEAWRRRGLLTRRLLRNVDVVLANTSFTLRRAVDANPELAATPAHIVPLGVHTALAEPTPAPAALPVAIMISRLHSDERYKGHDEVIAAWPLVRQRIPDAQLWIVGEGDLLPALESAVARHAVADAVRFFGRRTESEKQALLRQARCLLLPSAAEGFGLVYLEAMRLGRPCLVGNDGGREVVNPPEAGFAVTHRTPQEIADAVVRLLTLDAAWAERSAAARARYERAYTAAHFGERITAVLRAVTR